MAAAANSNISYWDWEFDYLDGGHLVCATNGNGNPDFTSLCLFLRVGLPVWFFLLGSACAFIRIKIDRVRALLQSFPERKGSAGKELIAQQRGNIRRLHDFMVAMLFSSAMMVILGCGAVYPLSDPLGIAGDFFLTLSYVSSGQMSFCARHFALQTRYMLPNNRKEVENDNKWCIAASVDVVEAKLTPLVYVLLTVLAAGGVISRYQLYSAIFGCCLLWGVALMYAILFTRLATLRAVVQIHNHHLGGEQAVVQRRQVTVGRMAFDLVAELATVFVTTIAQPLALLTCNIFASSTRLLILNCIVMPINLTNFTVITVIRYRILKAKQATLQSAATEVKKKNQPLLVSSSSIFQTSAAPACHSSAV